MIKIILIVFIFFLNQTVLASSSLKVLTTTTTLKSIVKEISGDHADVHSITKGPQDPHFVEAKPSYMVKARGADLVVTVGLDLEVG